MDDSGRDDVDVGQVGRDDTEGRGAGCPPIETGSCQENSDQGMSQVLHRLQPGDARHGF